ncbi:M20/M25/M40 family metallo-hydrolase [Helcococcus bovis]|uniref:M20/M25/M40 family metallo-hydrolase n=1 Tax=Helcococcus bovis TaxID=3153252 RepID=UPI0038B8215F
MAALYGLIALKNLGIIPKRSFRIVFGSNEEIRMDDIRHYLEVEDKPVMGFVPDNKFPAIYGERGRAVISINGNKERLKSFIKEYFSDRENITQKLGIDYEDEIFGKMILRGINTDLNLERGILKFSLSTPVCDIKEVLNLIKNKACGLKVQILSWNEWEIKNKNSTNVMLLNQVYNEITGQNLVPTTTTGMTYAHYIKNVIPFGPSFPGQNGIAHLTNEWIDIEDLIKCAKIYAHALYRYNEVEEIIK